jgi:hypothetical protein
MATPATQTNAQGSNTVTTVLIVAAVGLVAWKGFDFINKWREEKETDKARKNALKSELDTQKTKEKIATIENKSFTGVNGYGKTVTEFPILLAKKAITGFYNVINLQSGKTLYKAKPEIETAKILQAFYSTPLNAVSVFVRAYSAYTGYNFMSDINKLPYADQAKIKTVINVSKQKFPKGWN